MLGPGCCMAFCSSWSAGHLGFPRTTILLFFFLSLFPLCTIILGRKWGLTVGVSNKVLWKGHAKQPFREVHFIQRCRLSMDTEMGKVENHQETLYPPSPVPFVDWKVIWVSKCSFFCNLSCTIHSLIQAMIRTHYMPSSVLDSGATSISLKCILYLCSPYLTQCPANLNKQKLP